MIERIESPVFLVKSRDGAELKIVLAKVLGVGRDDAPPGRPKVSRPSAS
jgi:hypothetical protein